jgi:hypothetical protein
MANNITNVSFGQPTEMQDIQRRQQLAQMLQSQAMQPTETPQVPGGFAVKQPLGWGKILQGAASGYASREASEMAKALEQKNTERRGADMSLLAQALQGRQASPGGLQEDASGNVTQMDPMAGQTPAQSIGQALPMMQDPQMQQMAMQSLMGAQQRGDQQQFQREQLQSQQAGRLQERELATQAQNASRLQQQDFQREMVKERAAGDRPFYQFLQTPQGFMAGNARSGQVSPVLSGGKPVMPAQQDPAHQGQIAQAKAGGKETGEAQAQAGLDLPRVKDNASNALQIIDQMVGSEDGKTKAHPGFESYVGATMTPGMRFVEGSETANFEKLLDQSKGGAFLEAFNSLKGGGQITEVEGKKATDAITRMNKAQSEKEFVKAAREYQGIIKKGVERAKIKTGKYAGPERRVPDGIDPNLWSVMTPEEKALWAQ